MDDIHVDGVAKLLANLQGHKAHGPDGIPARLLKETAHSIIGVFEGGAKRGIAPPKPFLAPLKIFNDYLQKTDSEMNKTQCTL